MTNLSGPARPIHSTNSLILPTIRHGFGASSDIQSSVPHLLTTKKIEIKKDILTKNEKSKRTTLQLSTSQGSPTQVTTVVTCDFHNTLVEFHNKGHGCTRISRVGVFNQMKENVDSLVRNCRFLRMPGIVVDV